MKDVDDVTIRAARSSHRMMSQSDAKDFAAHRSFLSALAYRMLGSVADAEDVVQDAYLRWAQVDTSSVEHPRAFLARVVTRLCLDRMKSASVQREQYVGTWLPEPVIAAPAEPLADDLSVALLLVLERLSPLERAAFLLHEAFDMDFDDIADALGRSPEACRQLASRARQHVRAERPRFHTSAESRAKLLAAFEAVMTSGDLAAFSELLAEDVVLYADGGGKRPAALEPIRGKHAVLDLFGRLVAQRSFSQVRRFDRASINGSPGFVVHLPDGVQTLAFEVDGDRIVAVYVVRNPDKLRHLD